MFIYIHYVKGEKMNKNININVPDEKKRKIYSLLECSSFEKTKILGHTKDSLSNSNPNLIMNLARQK